ncbi:hypothetical protein LCGC14_1991310, partial [marine sediment metagenome]
NLLPGSYTMYQHYNILTGFSKRSADSRVSEVTIVKDTLKIIPANPFPEPLEMGYQYGAAYTFEYEVNGSRWWDVIYDGKIVNSLNQGVELANVSLFLEKYDRYVNIANVTTDIEGNFYLNRTVFGSFEINALAKIEYEEDDLYKKLVHEEYAGLEKEIEGTRFFRDEDFNGYPDWPYSLHDLLMALGGDTEDSVTFEALFNEDSGLYTYSNINNYTGELYGNVGWSGGVYGTPGIDLDGNGTIISGSSVSSVSNWHSEYDSEQTITSTSYTEKHTLDFNAPAQGDYLLIVSCEVAPVSTSASVGVRVQLDDTATIMEALYEGNNVDRSLEYRSESTMYVAENLISGSHSVDIDALQESGTGYIRYARIVVLRLDDWLTTTGMFKYAANEGVISLAGAEGQYSDTVSITFTPDQAGDYLVLASMEMYSGYTRDSISGRINYDGGSEYIPANNGEESYENYVTYESQDTTDYHAFTWGGIVNMPTNSKTISVQASRTGGSDANADVRRRRVIAIRLGAMSTDTQSIEDNSVTSTSSQWTDKSNLQFTPSTQQEYFIIGGIVIKPDSTSNPSHAELTHTTGTNTGTISLANDNSQDSGSPADCLSMLGIAIKELNVEQQIFKTRYGYAGSTGSTYSKGSFIVAVPLGGGVGGSDTPEYVDFDYVDFGGILNGTIGSTSNETTITAWVYPTELKSNTSSNAVQNVFLSKEGNLELGINQSGFLQVYIKNLNTEAVVEYGLPNIIPLGQWSY